MMWERAVVHRTRTGFALEKEVSGMSPPTGAVGLCILERPSIDDTEIRLTKQAPRR